MLIGLGGLAVWRFERHDPGSVSLAGGLLSKVAGGLGLVALALVLATILDVDSQQSVLDMAGPLAWPIVILAGVAVGARALQQAGVSLSSSAGASSLAGVVAIALVGSVAAYAFMFMATEQGLRAILFGLLVVAGFGLLAVAAGEAGRISPATQGTVLLLIALAGLVLAFFIRSASTSDKFRNEVFAVVLAISALVLIWAILSTLFETRSAVDGASDGVGGKLALGGLAAIAVGIVTRLLFTTDAEIAAGVPPANFRISVLWFIGFTVLATWMLGRTKFGSWIFAVGGNKEAARQIGVPAARTKTQLFMVVSVAAWLVGLLLAFRLNTIQSGTGNGLEFEYIIAAVVGGTFLTGGYGSAFGAAIGAVIMAMSKQGIPAARWNSDWRFAFLGVILLAAVIANNYIRTRAEGAKR